MITLKILAALLDYPNEEVIADLPELGAMLAADSMLPAQVTERVDEFIVALASRDLLEAQADWVEQFDRSRSLSLNLFEHVHGDSRDRGQAMVDLRAMYLGHGLEIGVSELPDYLPLLLEFLSTRPEMEALNLLAEAGHVVAALGQRLASRNSSYAPIMAAVASLAGVSARETGVVATPDVDDDLDEVWAEAPVEFGAGSALAGCPGGAAMAARLEGTGQ